MRSGKSLEEAINPRKIGIRGNEAKLDSVKRERERETERAREDIQRN